MDLTRLRVGKLELQFEKGDLSEVVQDVVDLYNSTSAEKTNPIHAVLEDAVTGIFDRARMSQVVTNLLSNALKYGGGTPIEVQLKTVSQNAVLSVRDFGPGIAADAQTRIFERFERVCKDKRITGLGLGLYITRQIVAAHGGTISVRSEPGCGAEFTVALAGSS